MFPIRRAVQTAEIVTRPRRVLRTVTSSSAQHVTVMSWAAPSARRPSGAEGKPADVVATRLVLDDEVTDLGR